MPGRARCAWSAPRPVRSPATTSRSTSRCGAGARATLQAAGASLAQGTGGAARCAPRVTLDAGARLAAGPAPLIVAHGSRVDVTVSIDLAADAAVDWHELLVLGRTGEPPGAATLRWDVTRAGRPVLRQFVDLADPLLAAWRGHDQRRAACWRPHWSATRRSTARTVVHSPTAVTARLDDHTDAHDRLADGTARRAISSTPSSWIRRGNSPS